MRLKRRIIKARNTLIELIEKLDLELKIIKQHVDSESESSQVEVWQNNWKVTLDEKERLEKALSILEYTYIRRFR